MELDDYINAIKSNFWTSTNLQSIKFKGTYA